MNFTRSMTVFAIILLLGQMPLNARMLRMWSFDELSKASDVIAIVEPVSNENNSDKGNGGPDQGVTTTFKVLTCLKGSSPDGTLVLKHFLYKKGEAMINPGMVVNFLIGPLDEKGTYTRGKETIPYVNEKVTPRWLAFLVKSPDGSYTPTSGQLDSSFSFQELHGVFTYGTMYSAEKAVPNLVNRVNPVQIVLCVPNPLNF